MPLNPKILNSAQTLLVNAGLIWEMLMQRTTIEDLLDTNYEVLGSVNHEPLQKILSRICRTSRIISQADWAIIYPFKVAKRLYEVEAEQIGYDGEVEETAGETKSKPRIGDVTRHILETDVLVVEDINKLTRSIGELNLNERHFIKIEDVKALIGVTIKNPYKQEVLGVLYLAFRRPKKFSELDVRHAQSLASLAVIAISNAHQYLLPKPKRAN
jgi:GAF domain-containing protein